MSKGKIIRGVLAAVLILLIVGSVASYIVEVVVYDTPVTERLFRMLATVFVCLGAIVKLFGGDSAGGRTLAFYEKSYKEHLEGAFSDSPDLRKKLLRAVKLYSENKLDRAANSLFDLKPHCQKKEDIYSVGLFIGLTLTEMNLLIEARCEYERLVAMNITSATIYGNLGYVNKALGNHEEAIANMRLAIQNDANNPTSYNNLAQLFFEKYDFESAKRFALKALDVDRSFKAPATLLAIIYSLEDDIKGFRKYSHIAVSNGETPERLKAAVDHFKAVKRAGDEVEKEIFGKVGEDDGSEVDNSADSPSTDE